MDHAHHDPVCARVQFWAEDRAYGGFFPRPATLIPACDHSPELEEDAGKLCSMCVRRRSRRAGACVRSTR
jgi:hypothetical protein